ncbi:MAG: 4Fe-4S binding protein [Adlercreutzia equolifaciens]
MTAISLAVVLVLALLFGRGWCAWGCPVPPIRRFFKREPKLPASAPAPAPTPRRPAAPFRLRGRARAGAKPLARPCVSYRPRPAYLDASGRAGRRLHRRLPAVLPGVLPSGSPSARWGRCGTSSWTSR